MFYICSWIMFNVTVVPYKNAFTDLWFNIIPSWLFIWGSKSLPRGPAGPTFGPPLQFHPLNFSLLLPLLSVPVTRGNMTSEPHGSLGLELSFPKLIVQLALLLHSGLHSDVRGLPGPCSLQTAHSFSHCPTPCLTCHLCPLYVFICQSISLLDTLLIIKKISAYLH